MVMLHVARGLHSTGPDPAADLFRRAIVHKLSARRVGRTYTFTLSAKVTRTLAAAGLFGSNRGRVAQRVWVDVEQDRDFQRVDGRYDWREGSAATGTAPGAAARQPASGRGAADAYAAGSISNNTCTGTTSHPCGYLTVQNQTANGIYCPSGAGSGTTNGQACGHYGTDSGSTPGPATVSGSMNQVGVPVGVAGSAVQCFVEGTSTAGVTHIDDVNPSNPVGFNNVDSSGNPQPYSAGSVSVSPGGSPAVRNSGYAVTEPIVANDTAQLASANDVAGVSGYMQGRSGLCGARWGLSTCRSRAWLA
jgi:hypothetical protein